MNNRFKYRKNHFIHQLFYPFLFLCSGLTLISSITSFALVFNNGFVDKIKDIIFYSISSLLLVIDLVFSIWLLIKVNQKQLLENTKQFNKLLKMFSLFQILYIVFNTTLTLVFHYLNKHNFLWEIFAFNLIVTIPDAISFYFYIVRRNEIFQQNKTIDITKSNSTLVKETEKIGKLKVSSFEYWERNEKLSDNLIFIGYSKGLMYFKELSTNQIYYWQFEKAFLWRAIEKEKLNQYLCSLLDENN